MHEFKFEGLIVYQLAVEVARWMRTTRWPPGTTHLKDRACELPTLSCSTSLKACRAAGGPAPTICASPRGQRAKRFAALDVANFEGCAENRQKLRRIGAMLTGLGAR